MLTIARAEALVKRFQSGDERALNDILEEFAPLAGYTVRRALRRYGGMSHEPPEHLLQEARIGLWRAAVSYRKGAGQAFRTWATDHMRFRISQYLRDNGRLVRVPQGRWCDAVQIAELCEDIAVSDDYGEAEIRDAVERVLEALPPAAADLMRRRLRGETMKDSAIALGMSVTTTTRLYAKVKKMLREALGC